MSHCIPAGRAAWLPLALAVSLLCSVSDVGSAPMLAPTPEASADGDYNAGLHEKAAKRFPAAVASFRRAVDARPNFPEAWNELGFALRQTGKYDEALRAYEQALKLRPNFPEALEYLGETYVKLGRLGDARAILDRLKPLDAARATELEEAIRTVR
jgi:Flp pilus assembly protein TadD